MQTGPGRGKQQIFAKKGLPPNEKTGSCRGVDKKTSRGLKWIMTTRVPDCKTHSLFSLYVKR